MPLDEVTAALRGALEMPAFDFDGEGSWDYAYSERPGLGLNVTRARKPGVIDSWVPGTPDGSVYQIIAYARGATTALEDVRRGSWSAAT